MPSADVLGVIIGILFIIPTIYFIRTKDWDKVAWPFFLITLPVYYMLFGVLAMDGTAILNEFSIRITLHYHRSSGMAHALKGGVACGRAGLVEPWILRYLPRYFIYKSGCIQLVPRILRPC